MQIEIIQSLSDVSADEWNALSDGNNPFVRHEFLAALETHGAVSEKYGWLPCHVVIREAGVLLAAMPMYMKNNSYGEFVFDWSWADAYARNGLAYYPKLVTSIPYTPASGPRFLVRADADYEMLARTLLSVAIQFAGEHQFSSWHGLFTDAQDTAMLKQQPEIMLRLGCQFHWHNQGYRDFDDYLDEFVSKKRKQIKRERRIVQEQHVELEILNGHQITDTQWAIYHRFYESTFLRKNGMPTLSLEFFQEIATTMPDNIVLVMARHQGEYVASAFNLRGQNTLYGRHWGCAQHFEQLHFEACYYQGLDYCIQHGLRSFEPGAQGEHKIARGFLPTETWSAHWIADPQFKNGIAQFLQQETRGMLHYIDELATHSPFKQPQTET